ncbi:photosynthetic NDH subunit of subcomplex B 4, chloroplastic-like isoform X1 [Tasmannia lanceolata]|uniref:photosynthetic NDH subunit of subcomplex B 4, chloroplastic-like isoform X1 n=1 Tax=Tasmannia lanceolata TaxID=3420 RepID=UPI0040644376
MLDVQTFYLSSTSKQNSRQKKDQIPSKKKHTQIFLQVKEMAEAVVGFTMPKPPTHNPALNATKMEMNPFPKTRMTRCSSSRLKTGWLQGLSLHLMKDEGLQVEGISRERASSLKVKAFPDLPLMAVIVEHVEGQRDLVLHKSVWHLNDETMKNVYTMYVMFTCWGCCFFGSAKDPFYDGEQYRSDGGDGTGHWVYEKQEDIEENARSELWREELIEEIEQKVGGLRELEEAGRKEEELVK